MPVVPHIPDDVHTRAALANTYISGELLLKIVADLIYHPRRIRQRRPWRRTQECVKGYVVCCVFFSGLSCKTDFLVLFVYNDIIS